MKLIKNICLVCASVAAFSSCQKDLMDLAPYDKIGSGNMWQSENMADMGVLGIYNNLRNGNVAGSMYVYDSYGVSSSCRDPQSLLRGNATSGSFGGEWKSFYEGISRANDAIANLGNAPVKEDKKARLLAESKFLRAFYYSRLNMLYKGVPVYTEPTQLEDLTKGRSSVEDVWNLVVQDLTDAINTASLPDKYAKGSADYGRITKGAAYALRGKAYMWMKDWAKAAADFRKVGDCGYSLFQGEYKQLFKEANEQCDEMIFSLQCVGLSGYGNDYSFRFGTRSSFGSCWNSYLVNTDFAESYECKDGKPFNWNDFIPGYNQMSPEARSVYFLRDNMTDKQKEKMASDGADLSKYLENGNEARIRTAYDNRDPRLEQTIITPYAKYLGATGATAYTFTLRWPYVGYDSKDPFDLKTDTNNRYYYLWRKFVAEGASEIPNRAYSPIDIPLIRYADVLLNLAECLNELGQEEEAIACVNQVRNRAGVAALNSNEYTQVNGKADLLKRIQNERRWELAGEGVTFFDELRWGTWEEAKFAEKNGIKAGLKQIWGSIQFDYTFGGKHFYNWAIPRTEIEMNENLVQNDGWID